MTENDILSAAMQVGLVFELPPDKLFAFAALIAAHEREACAEISAQWDIDHPSSNYGGCIAAAIRSRT